MTAVQWLIKKISEPVLMINWYRDELYKKAKEMEKQQMIISDEEIEEEIHKRYMNPIQDYAWRDACKWYREKLKSKL